MSAKTGEGAGRVKTSGRRYVQLYLALTCLLVFIIGFWWSWRYAPLPDPLQPAEERSFRQWLFSPIERNAFRRLPVITGDLNGVYAVKDTGQVWAVGDGGLILHSADGGDTWERQENIDWSPSAPAPPEQKAKAADAATPFSFIQNANAAEQSPSLPPDRIAEIQRFLAELGYDPGPADRAVGARTIEAVRRFQADQKLEVNGELSDGLLQQLAEVAYARGTPEQTTLPEQSQHQAPVEQGQSGTVTENPSNVPEPQPVDLHAVAFTDTGHGIIVGVDGVILVTQDSGATWEEKESGTAALLLSVAFATPERAVVVGADGAILVSTDAGETWAVKASGTAALLLSVAFATPERAVVVGADGAILVSTDAGETWAVKASGTGVGLWSVAFVTPERAVVVGADGAILVSTDAGETWAAKSSGTEVELTSVAFATPGRVVAVGAGGTILVSADAGETWAEKESVTRVSLESVAFATPGRVVAVGTYGNILVSTDGGETWAAKARGSDAVGAGGTILTSIDGGETWIAKNRGIESGLSSVVFATPERAVAVGVDGTILVSADVGETWEAKSSGTGAWLYSVASAMPGRVVAVGMEGTILVSTDAGETWAAKTSGTEVELTSVAFATPGRVVAVGAGGTILVSADGGETWAAKTRGDDGALLFSVAFATPERAVAMSWNGTILVSTDAGETWETKESGIEAWPFSIAFATPERTLAVGAGGAILLSADAGETWAVKTSGTEEWLYSVTFATPERALAVGVGGTILLSTDGGKTWAAKASGTGVGVASVAFATPERALAVGEADTILVSADAGETWVPVAYARYPAPFFLIFSGGALLFGLVGGWRAWRYVPVERVTQTVTDLFASDRPLQPGERDALGLNEIAAGISRFLRNRSTDPPLTIAVTGEWGSGKSSLMGLLHHDLRGRGYRPVWFNAWHHQRGENLLASLYANIREQGIPSTLTPEGLGFRWNLLNIRARRYWLRLALTVLLGGLLLMYFLYHQESGKVLIDIVSQEWGSFEGKWRVSGGLLALLAFPLHAAFKALSTFGLDPKKLLGTLAAPGEGIMTAQPGVRYQFAHEFNDVARALKPHTLVIFIDDLDRCAQEHVLEVLETINFLVTAGDCFFVLGMSRRWVETCVGLEFSELAAEVSDDQNHNHPLVGESSEQQGEDNPAAAEDPRDERRRFARQYLEKLINIEVPIPEVSDAASIALLKTESSEPLPWMARAAMWAQSVSKQAWIPVLLIGVLLGTKAIAPYLPEISKPSEPIEIATEAVLPKVQETAGQAEVLGQEKPATDKEKVDAVSFIPGAIDPWAEWWAAMAAGLGGLALLGLVLVLVARSNRVEIEDSKEFGEALEIMRPWILLGHPTPRLLKRYLNHVRFIAMRQRHDAEPGSLLDAARRALKRLLGFPPEERAGLALQAFGEPLLVALSALQQARPDWQTEPTWLSKQYGLLAEGQYRDLLNLPEVPVEGEQNIEIMVSRLHESLTAYNQHFKNHQLFVNPDHDRNAIDTLLELMAGVRTEWNEGLAQTTSSA